MFFATKQEDTVRHQVSIALCSGLLAMSSAGCNEHGLNPFDSIIGPGVIERTDATQARPVDILFVVDNSGSMRDKRLKVNAAAVWTSPPSALKMPKRHVLV